MKHSTSPIKLSPL